jgi:hypothetical protein
VLSCSLKLAMWSVTGGENGTSARCSMSLPPTGGLNQVFTYDAWGNANLNSQTIGYTNQNQWSLYIYDAKGRLSGDGFLELHVRR